MNILKLTVGDTKPIKASYPGTITGATLLIGSVSKTASITDAENGFFQFARTEGDLAEGRYDCAIVITDAEGTETTEQFAAVVSGRPS